MGISVPKKTATRADVTTNARGDERRRTGGRDRPRRIFDGDRPPLVGPGWLAVGSHEPRMARIFTDEDSEFIRVSSVSIRGSSSLSHLSGSALWLRLPAAPGIIRDQCGDSVG